jgi:peptidoglycan/LPS O-acetylase OafA/YrhL
MTTTSAGKALAGRIAGIEELRGIAALSVLLFHAVAFTTAFQTPGGRWLMNLNVGVWAFFAISGFVLYRPWAAAHLGAGSPVRYRAYALRRALRIYPAYWFVLAFFVWVIPEIVNLGSAGAIAHVFLFQDYLSTGVERITTGLPVAWTLVIELTFYCTLPAYSIITGWAGARWNARIVEITAPVLIILGGVFAIHATVGGETSSWLKVLPAHLPAFGAGMLLAVVDVLLPREHAARDNTIATSRTLWWGLAALLFLWIPMVMETTPGDASTPEQLVGLHLLRAGIGTAVLVPIALARRRAKTLPGGAVRLMIFLGTVSYGVYLWHYPVLALVQRELLGWTVFTGYWPILALVSLPIVLACATVSWLLIESPAIRLSHRVAQSAKEISKR